MLRQSSMASYCIERAQACAERATVFPSNSQIRNDFLTLEQSWLRLAKNYQATIDEFYAIDLEIRNEIGTNHARTDTVQNAD